MSDEEPETFVEGDSVYQIDSTGIRKGLDFRTFYWKNRKTGKMLGPYTALGKRNLEFRRIEAEKNNYDFHACEGNTCNHPETESQ